MSSFYPPPPPRDSDAAGGPNTAVRRDTTPCVFSKLKHFASTPDKKTRTLFYLALTVAALVALGIVSNLPPWGKAFLLNVGACLYPAFCTIEELGSGLKDKPPAYAAYWVIFALSTTLDPILRPITPLYYFSKTCLLAWAASPARPYGGRPLLTAAFEAIINNSPRPLQTVKPLAELEKSVADHANIPPRCFRLALAVVAFAGATVGIGVCAWVLLFVEGVFCGLPGWIQANVCVLAGSAWPLYATLRARARVASKTAALECAANEKGGGQKNQAAEGAASPSRSQGPAAVQWLSYWPMYAFLLILDPLLGWVPHFYAAKIVILALLASPETRGAYLLTSLFLQIGGDPGKEEGDAYSSSGSSSAAAVVPSDKLISPSSSGSMDWVGVAGVVPE